MQKTDLIAELKRTKDIPGIKKLKVERAQVEKTQEQNLMSEISKAFSVTNFVDQVSAKISLYVSLNIQNTLCITCEFCVCDLICFAPPKRNIPRLMINERRDSRNIPLADSKWVKIRNCPFYASFTHDSFIRRSQKRIVREMWYRSGNDRC